MVTTATAVAASVPVTTILFLVIVLIWLAYRGYKRKNPQWVHYAGQLERPLDGVEKSSYLTEKLMGQTAEATFVGKHHWHWLPAPMCIPNPIVVCSCMYAFLLK